MLTFNHIVEGMKPSFAKPEFAIAKSKTSQFSNEITFFSMNQRVTIFGFFDSRTSYVFLNKAQWESICHFSFKINLSLDFVAFVSLSYIPYARHYNSRVVYFLPTFGRQFSRRSFRKILYLCMVSIQERVMMARIW